MNWRLRFISFYSWSSGPWIRIVETFKTRTIKFFSKNELLEYTGNRLSSWSACDSWPNVQQTDVASYYNLSHCHFKSLNFIKLNLSIPKGIWKYILLILMKTLFNGQLWTWSAITPNIWKEKDWQISKRRMSNATFSP